jgi:hypothetical protein
MKRKVPFLGYSREAKDTRSGMCFVRIGLDSADIEWVECVAVF